MQSLSCIHCCAIIMVHNWGPELRERLFCSYAYAIQIILYYVILILDYFEAILRPGNCRKPWATVGNRSPGEAARTVGHRKPSQTIWEPSGNESPRGPWSTAYMRQVRTPLRPASSAWGTSKNLTSSCVLCLGNNVVANRRKPSATIWSPLRGEGPRFTMYQKPTVHNRPKPSGDRSPGGIHGLLLHRKPSQTVTNRPKPSGNRSPRGWWSTVVTIEEL